MPASPPRHLHLARCLALVAGLLGSGSGWAHPGHLHDSLLAGIGHPLTGLDHLLAMLAVGIWAAWQPSGSHRPLWLPLGFLAAAAAGTAVAATSALAVPAMVETAVSLTLLLLGALLLARWQAPAVPGLVLVLACGLLHGAAHGRELGALGLAPALGFMMGTALLHAAGFGLLRALHPAGRRVLMIGGGAGTALVGGWLLA